MILHQPCKKTLGDKVRLLADFELNGRIDTLWYEIDKKYEKFLVTEQCDPFLLIILIKAIEENQDIEIKSQVSSKLYYGLINYIIPYLSYVFKSNQPKLNAFKLNNNSLNIEQNHSVGMSCGVDSMSTYINNNYECKINEIEYFTFFNVGSHGNIKSNYNLVSYESSFQNAKSFAQLENKVILEVNSNMSDILKSDFKSTHTFRNISAALIFQKLIKNYYYSSAFKFTQIQINPKDPSSFDVFLLQGLSTESTYFYSSMLSHSREERVELISNYSNKLNSFIDVCVTPNHDTEFLNCSSCYKCIITQIVLEINGTLKEFDKSFDLQKFYERKDKFIARLMLDRKKNILFNNLYNYIIEKDSSYIKTYHSLLSVKLKFYRFKRNILFKE